MSSILHLISVFNSNVVNHATHDDDPLLGADGWFPFEDVNSKVNNRRASEFAVCATNRNGDLHICSFNNQELLHTIRFVNGNWQPFWGDVESQVPQGPDIRPVAAVACAANMSGDLHVCAIDISGKNLWHTIRFVNGNWQPFWGDVQSQVPQGPDIRP
jgi:hypothetical protein